MAKSDSATTRVIPVSKPDPANVAAVRQLDRFYTREIGVLREGLLDSEFTLAEARVLYELGQRGTTAAVLGDQFDSTPATCRGCCGASSSSG